MPGCAAWGYTKEEALKAIQDAAEAYIADMIDAGEALPSQGQNGTTESVRMRRLPAPDLQVGMDHA